MIGLDLLEPYITRIKKETGLLIGIQTPPHPDLSRYDRLRAMGVNRVSFCFEIYDRERFREVCPGKHAQYGIDRYLDAIRYCASLADRGPKNEPWVTNGEIIAGHTRWKAAKELGLDRVPVRYLDLDPADAHLLAIADNRVAEEASS